MTEHGFKEHKGFTPGPWVRSTFGYNILTGDSMHSLAAVHPPVWIGNFEEEMKEHVARASLIADAPAMHQKLLAIRNAVRMAKQTGDFKGALEVIAVAVGESLE